LRARFELKADRAVGLFHQKGRELAAGPVRHEAAQDLGAAGRQQIFHLRALDRLLQDDLPDRNRRSFRRPGSSRIRRTSLLEHAGIALRAGADRRLIREVDRFVAAVVAVRLARNRTRA